jgi:hypothetical protein
VTARQRRAHRRRRRVILPDWRLPLLQRRLPLLLRPLRLSRPSGHLHRLSLALPMLLVLVRITNDAVPHRHHEGARTMRARQPHHAHTHTRTHAHTHTRTHAHTPPSAPSVFPSSAPAPAPAPAPVSVTPADQYACAPSRTPPHRTVTRSTCPSASHLAATRRGR